VFSIIIAGLTPASTLVTKSDTDGEVTFAVVSESANQHVERVLSVDTG
jgi:hypothetical protein